MAIDKLKNRHGISYRVRVLINGSRVSRCFGRKVDAEKWEADAILNGRANSYKKTRFDELCQLFVEKHVKSLRFSSYQRYESTVRLYIRPYFGKRFIHELKRFDVIEFRAEVEKFPVSNSMRNFIVSTFKTMMKKAQEWELLDRNPSEGVKPPKKGLPRTEYWTESEVAKFLAAMEHNPRLPMYLIALNTGMRISEIFGLKWDCVDFENGFITVRRMYCQKSKCIRETTKTHRSRHIGINPTLRNVLLRLKQSSQSEFVFGVESFRCGKASHASRVLREDCIRSGVRVIKFHDLRHTFATHFALNGGSIHALAGMLGHTATAMTARYAHFGQEHARRAAQVVSFDVPKHAKVIPLQKAENRQ